MDTTFGELQIMERFMCSINGTEYVGQKIAPFSMLSPERTSYIRINAILNYRHKVIAGREGFVASVCDLVPVFLVKKAA